ncbi:hypothetical protein LX36DRAFT_674369 [Colletotrichum falcatum]|nr:hypothetical protein LX36DRAFT_674369 [Colletotrichum falcatum]
MTSIATAKPPSSTSATRHQDPYILAVLIALAQSRQRHHAQSDPPSTTQNFQVCVVVSDAKQKSHLILYTAEMPVVFLDRLTTPHKRPAAAWYLVIRSVDIPFEPYLSFPERLTHVVTAPRPNCCWDTHPSDKDTRESKRRKIAQGTGHDDSAWAWLNGRTAATIMQEEHMMMQILFREAGSIAMAVGRRAERA